MKSSSADRSCIPGCRHLKKTVFAGLLLLAALSSRVSAYENETVSVISSRASIGLDNGYSTTLTLHKRFVEGFKQSERNIAEISLNKDIGNSRISGAYNIHFDRRFQAGNEHRLWQQYRYNLPLEAASMDFWARLEERYFPETGKAGGRVRLVTYWNKDLSAANSFRLGNELVLNLNTYAAMAQRGFSQDRLLAGFRHRLRNGTRVDLNYQYRYVHRPLAGNFIQHQLQMMLVFDL